MRVLVHDFSGHPFQAQLARSLADAGHEVLHVECSSYPSGKGAVGAEGGPGATFESISLGREFERYRVLRRMIDEMRYGVAFVRRCRRFGADVVISCNDPLLAKAIFGVWARLRGLCWVFWLQDIYSVAMAREAERRSPVGRVVGRGLQWVERRLLRDADAVVPISGDFLAALEDWRIDATKTTVIENWAPLDEVPVRSRDNAWRASAGLGDRFVYLYAGTLGLKHNPGLLADLAAAEPTAEVVVASEGIGADELRRAKEDRGLSNLRILGYQPWDQIPDMLGAADVLLVLLEPDAGVYSVPSKILTSLCAGRPILASMPAANLGARTIDAARAGIIVPPGEQETFVEAARQLREGGMREEMGARARRYAESAFDIDEITGRFEDVLELALDDTQQGERT